MPIVIANSTGRWERILQTLGEAVRGFQKHQASRLGAALAFYSLLSLSPLLLLVLAIVGAIFGPDAARGEITSQIEGLVGRQGAQAIQAVVANADQSTHSLLAAAFGTVVLIAGATCVFVELKAALDTIWETPLTSHGLGLKALVIDRVLALAIICGLAFLSLISLFFSALLAAVGKRLAVGGLDWPIFDEAFNALAVLILTSLMFAMIYRLLPTARPPWSQVWFGACVTATLFVVGKTLIGAYLGRASIGSAYGAAGSLVVLLVWVYYSTQIFLFGAEITRAHSQAPGLMCASQSWAVKEIDLPSNLVPYSGDDQGRIHRD